MHSPLFLTTDTHTHTLIEIQAPLPPHLSSLPFCYTLYKQKRTPLLCFPQPLWGETTRQKCDITSELHRLPRWWDFFFLYKNRTKNNWDARAWFAMSLTWGHQVGTFTHTLSCVFAFKLLNDYRETKIPTEELSFFAATLPMCCPLAYL